MGGKTSDTYTNKSKSRAAAAKETATMSKQKFSHTKFSIMFSRNGITVEHTKKGS